MVKLVNWIAFSSKNLVVNLSMLSWRIRFSILIGWVIGVGGCRAISLFGGICKIIGR